MKENNGLMHNFLHEKKINARVPQSSMFGPLIVFDLN